MPQDFRCIVGPRGHLYMIGGNNGHDLSLYEVVKNNTTKLYELKKKADMKFPR